MNLPLCIRLFKRSITILTVDRSLYCMTLCMKSHVLWMYNLNIREMFAEVSPVSFIFVVEPRSLAHVDI